MSIKPTLSVYRTKFVHILESGEEKIAETGLRVLLRYPGGSMENRSFEIVGRDSDFSGLPPAELLRKAVDMGSIELQDTVEYALQRLDGVEIGGTAYTWDELAAQGFDVLRSASPRR